MSKLLPMIVALGLAVAFTAPAVAGTGPNTAPPTMKSTCEKAKMHWDDKAKRCCASATSTGHCM
jgi:hypothetical protein